MTEKLYKICEIQVEKFKTLKYNGKLRIKISGHTSNKDQNYSPWLSKTKKVFGQVRIIILFSKKK